MTTFILEVVRHHKPTNLVFFDMSYYCTKMEISNVSSSEDILEDVKIMWVT